MTDKYYIISTRNINKEGPYNKIKEISEEKRILEEIELYIHEGKVGNLIG